MKSIIFKILGVVVVIVAIVVGKLIGKASVETYSSSKKESNFNSMLMKTASELNQNLPMMVDSETRLDATVGINKTFRYNYTLVNYSSNDVTAKEIKDGLTEQVTNYVCTTKSMEIFVKNDITITYAYYSKEGKEITTIPVPSYKCKDI